MWRIVGVISVLVALVEPLTAQEPKPKQVNPYFGQCRTAVMNKPGMLDPRGGGTCGRVCGAAIRQCIANKGKI
jgi:hypothetical protein